MNYHTLAEVALEVAEFYPDVEGVGTRAEWRHKIITISKHLMLDCKITEDTQDLDEIVVNYLTLREMNNERN